MSEFKKTKVCEKCYMVDMCTKLALTTCQRAVRLEAVKLPIMPQGFKKRIMRVVDK